MKREPRPRIDVTTSAKQLAEVLPWKSEATRAHVARNEEALARWSPPVEGTCAWCLAQGPLHISEPTNPDSDLVCTNCCRDYNHSIKRYTPCDNDPSHGAAWRDPKTRRNEYLCGNCHAAQGRVVQNRWARVEDLAPRVSLPLGLRDRAECEARNVAGTKDCRGEVKPRGAGGALLCNAHAGKQSAAGNYFD